MYYCRRRLIDLYSSIFNQYFPKYNTITACGIELSVIQHSCVGVHIPRPMEGNGMTPILSSLQN